MLTSYKGSINDSIVYKRSKFEFKALARFFYLANRGYLAKDPLLLVLY